MTHASVPVHEFCSSQTFLLIAHTLSINFLITNRVISLPHVEPSGRRYRLPSTGLLETNQSRTIQCINTYAGRLNFQDSTIQSLPDEFGGSTIVFLMTRYNSKLSGSGVHELKWPTCHLSLARENPQVPLFMILSYRSTASHHVFQLMV